MLEENTMNKMRKIKHLSLISAFSLLLLLAACSGNTPAEPTMSPDAIYTAAAETVQAEIATKAALNPTATNTPIPLPTNTLPAINPTAGTVPLGGTPGAPLSSEVAPTAMLGAPMATLTPLPTFTLAAGAPAQAKYELTGQDPADGTVLQKDYNFDAMWTIKNTGTTTWTKEYTLVFFTGDRLNPGNTANYYKFRSEVPPGESITVFADMKTPLTAGSYYSWWKLKDDTGQNFGDLDLTIKVQ